MRALDARKNIRWTTANLHLASLLLSGAPRGLGHRLYNSWDLRGVLDWEVEG